MLLSHHYTPIYQLPYCCVPATLQWILYRRGFDILDQQSIGAELGLQLPIKGRKLFTHSGIVFTDITPEAGYGTQIHKPQYSIQSFFNKHDLPLKISELGKFNSENKLAEFLTKNFTKNNDIIIRFHTEVFKKNETSDTKSYSKSSGHGHFSVLTAFKTETRQITIGNPDLPFFQQISLSDLLLAMSDKFDCTQRGLYVITGAGNQAKTPPIFTFCENWRRGRDSNSREG